MLRPLGDAVNAEGANSSPESRSWARTAQRAGEARITLGVLGVTASFYVPGLRGELPVTFGYLLFALLSLWGIRRRIFESTTRAVLMGLIDVACVTYVTQRMGSLTSLVPLLYVATPVLYATTTSLRRISLMLALAGTGAYAFVVLLEQVGLLPYASGTAPLTAAPDAGTAVGSVLLVAVSSLVTSWLLGQLIAALNAANARLRDQSQHDELTGLFNRRYVLQRLGDELARHKRKPGLVTVAMVDLDGFKRVNDEVGHDAGDAVLKAVATALLVATRKADVVARYGGDEFVILFPNTEPDGIRAVGARILDQSRTAARSVCPTIPVSASIGTTVLRETDEPGDVIRRVDEQLYVAKRAGGDRISSG
jgi:diguanylate cyclase (GGDEF)-like protein